MPQDNKNQNKENETPEGALVHTYAEDLAEEIKKKQGKAYREAIDEEKIREESEESKSPTSAKNIFFIIFSIIFIGLAIILIYFAVKKEKKVTIEIPSSSSVFTGNKQSEINITDISPDKVLEEIKIAIGESLDQDLIKTISFTKKEVIVDETTGETTNQKQKVPAKDLFFFLNIKTPELFIKSISPDFVFGSYSCNGTSPSTSLDSTRDKPLGASPSTSLDSTRDKPLGASRCEKKGLDEKIKNQAFLILDILFPNNAFRGAKDWEEKMLFYLYDFLDTKVSFEDTKLFETPFKDIVVKNLDARILEDEKGKTIIIYGFWNDQKMIVTTDKNVFAEIVRKLQ